MLLLPADDSFDDSLVCLHTDKIDNKEDGRYNTENHGEYQHTYTAATLDYRRKIIGLDGC